VVPADALTAWSFDLTMPVEGENLYVLTTRDGAGNWSSDQPFSIVLDRVAPAFQWSSPADASCTATRPNAVTFEFVDQTTGIDGAASLVTGVVQDSQAQSVMGSWAFTPPGSLVYRPTSPFVEESYTASIDAIDLAGNATSRSITFTYDATAPAPPTLNPVQSPTHLDHQVLAGTKEADTALWINGMEVISLNGDTTWSYDLPLIEGENLLSIHSRDRAGSQSTPVTAVILYDDISPLPVPVTADGSGAGTTVTLDWSGYDEQGQEDVARYHIYAQMYLYTQVVTLTPVTTVPAGTFGTMVTGLTAGEDYYFAVVAEDVNGNLNTSVTPVHAVPTDTIAPEDVTDLAVQCQETALIFYWTHSTDSAGDLAGYHVYFNGAADPVALADTENSFQANALTAATVYPIRVTAVDHAGNESAGIITTGVTLLANPTNLAGEGFSGYVDLSWDPVLPADLVKHYAVYVGTADFNSTAAMTPVLTATGTGTKVAGLTNDTLYYFAVTTVNTAGGERTIVTTITATPVDDTQGPSTQDIQIGGQPLTDGATVSQSAMITLSAGDPAGMSRVEFFIDGALVHTDTNGADGYSFFLDIDTLTDGSHTFTVVAYDTLGNATTVDYTLDILLGAPAAAPIIVSPVDGALVNKTPITVTGTALLNTEVLFTIDDADTGVVATTDDTGRFTTELSLNEGANRLNAAARNRGGTGPAGSEILVTLDTTLPSPPTNLLAESRELGAIRLGWNSPEATEIQGYRVYRAASPFTSVGDALLLNTTLLTTTTYYDQPTSDGTWYYRIATVDPAANESDLSESASAVSDRIGPSAVSIVYTPEGPHDPATGRMGPGLVNFNLTVSEPLQAEPFLTIAPDGGTPLSVDLFEVSDLSYSGYFTIGAATPSGNAAVVFSARDKAGNRGTAIESGNSIAIDTRGPAVIVIAIDPPQPVRNDENSPVSVDLTIGLDEPMAGGQLPDVACLLSATGRVPEAVSNLIEIPALPGHAQTWQAAYSLPADAGLAEPETFRLIYAGVDDLGNLSAAIMDPNRFQVYQGDLPPLDTPAGLAAQSLPQGRIRLTWSAVDGAAGYRIFRQAPVESVLTLYAEPGVVLEYTDTPAVEGTYFYAVASIREDNGETAVSALSDTVSAESDATVPDSPAGLTIDLTAQGILAQWTAPVGEDNLTYRLYRDAGDILTVDGLTPAVDGITLPEALDAQPGAGTPYYAVMAVDASGNESAPSASAYLNLDLLPVSSLTVTQTDDDLPVVAWGHPGGAIDGFNIYVGPVNDLQKINESLLFAGPFVDTGYGGDTRRYTLIAVDDQQQESLPRSITLPSLDVTFADGQTIKRGVINRVEYHIENRSPDPVTDAVLKLRVDTRDHVSVPFSVDAAQTVVVPVVVGGHEDLPDIADLTATVQIYPHAGEVVEIVRTGTVPVGNDMLVLTILNDTLTRGATATVRFSLINSGKEAIELVTARGSSPSDEIALLLNDADGNTLSSATYQETVGAMIYNLADGTAVARIPEGKTFTSGSMSLDVPVSATDTVTLELRIGHIHYLLGSPQSVTMEGPIALRQVALVDAPYTADIISVTPQLSNGDQDVAIVGQVRDSASGQPAADVPVKLVLTVNGYERDFGTMCDGGGNFTFIFTPLAGEYGAYRVSAVHPDINARPDQGQFEIRRVGVTADEQTVVKQDEGPGSVTLAGVNPTTINLSSPRNYENTIGIKVFAGSEDDATDVNLFYDTLYQPEGSFPAGVHVVVGEALPVIAAGATGTVNFTVWADNTAAESGRIVFKVISNGDTANPLGTIIVNLHFTEAFPVLRFTPDHIETGMAVDASIVETVRLENKGLAAMKNVRVSLVGPGGTAAPDWVLLNTDPVLGNLNVGDAVEVPLTFRPGAQVAEGNYTLALRVESDNHATTDINVFAAVSQSGTGHALFKVADIYTATLDDNNELIQGLAGATIALQNEVFPDISAQMTSDVVGEARFQDLQAGRYKFKVSARNHQEIIGRMWIKPGITASEYVFLGYNLVTIEWSVAPTVFEDHYTIQLNATYETDVPAAVIVAEPASITLPEMVRGDVYNGEFYLTNYGLIRGDEVNFDLPEDDANFKYELLAGLPDSLLAKQRIRVPYRVTCIKTPGQVDDGAASGGGDCIPKIKKIKVTTKYECSDGTTFTADSTHTIIHWVGDCNISLPGGGGGGGGDGGEVPPDNDDVDDHMNYWAGHLSGIAEMYNISGAGGLLAQLSGPGGGAGSGETPLDIVVCWPVSERQETIFDRNATDVIKDTLVDTGCWVNAVAREYNDEMVDLSVKVPGGKLEIYRKFFENKWHWDFKDSFLEIVRNQCDEVVAVVKDGVPFRRSGSAFYDNQTSVYFTNGTYKIINHGALYTWKDKYGNYRNYDSTGRLIEIGDRNRPRAHMAYSSGKLVWITNRNHVPVLWYEYTGDALTAIRDGQNRRVDYAYTGSGRLHQVTDTDGKVTTYNWLDSSEGPRLMSTQDAAGRWNYITYDGQGNVVNVKDRHGVGHRFEYSYNDARKEYFSRIRSTSGMIKEVWYDKDGDVKRVDINGRTVEKYQRWGGSSSTGNLTVELSCPEPVVYGERTFGGLVGILEPMVYTGMMPVSQLYRGMETYIDEKGNTTRKYLDALDNVIRVEYADGSVESFVYDSRYSNITRKVDPLGVVTTFEYDSRGNLVKQIDAAGTPSERVRTFVYNGDGRLESSTLQGDSQTDPATLAFTYDAADNTRTITDAEGQVTDFMSFNSFGDATLTEDARGNQWHYAYDDLGRLTSRTDPQGHTTAYEYDAAGNRTAVVNPLSRRFEFVYDDHNNRSRVIGPDGKSSRTVYNTDNLPTYFFDRSGKFTHNYYDNEGRRTKTVDGVGNAVVFRYDATLATPANSTQVVQIDYPTYSTRYYYDKMQRVIRETDFSGDQSRSTTFGYDKAGRLVSTTDPDGHTTRLTYDALGRLKTVTNPMGQTVERVYDDRDNVIELITPDGNSNFYEYDRNNRLVKETLPGARETVFTYDAVGNRDSVTKANGDRIIYDYDTANRIASETHYAAPDYTAPVSTVTYAYNDLGQLTGWDNGTVSAVFTYDDFMRKTTETVDYGDFSLSYAYTYTDNHRKRTFTGPDGITYTYTYDPADRMTAIDIPGQGTMTVNAFDWKRPAIQTLPGGSRIDYSWDAFLQASGIHAYDPGDNLLGGWLYDYSPGGRMTGRSSTDSSFNFDYDDGYQLSAVADASGVIEAYTYDSMGNRSSSLADGTWSYGDGNTLDGYGDVSFDYDANGRMIRRTTPTGALNFFYNVEGRLIRVEDENDAIVATYGYDPFGRRLWKDVGGTRTYFFYSEEGLCGEYDAAGQQIAAYGYAPGSTWTNDPVFQKRGSQYYWYVNDHLGTPRKMFTTAGSPVWDAAYAAFGGATLQQNTVENNLRLAGQYADAETGLHYNWNRYYDPATGRYNRLDPLRDGINMYAYALNNPLKLIDPNGLCNVRRFFSGANDAFRMWTGLADDEEIIDIGRRGDIEYAEIGSGYIRDASIWINSKLALLAGSPAAAVAAKRINTITGYAHEGIQGYINNGVGGAVYQTGVHGAGQYLDGMFGKMTENLNYIGQEGGKKLDGKVGEMIDYLKSQNKPPSKAGKPQKPKVPQKQRILMPF
jgi:RHS repeat-associated protein